MKILIVASEAIPFVKTGGLADVMGTLIREIRNLKVDARLALPLYRGIKDRFDLNDTGHEITVPVGNKNYTAKIFSYKDSVFFIECNEFFDREELYGTSEGDYPDNAHRFIFFSRAVLEACDALGFKPDVLHCNDWQTGLIPLYVKSIYKKSFSKTATVMTIHNLGYQGIFPASAMLLTGLDMELFTPKTIEFYGQINLLKAGITTADFVTTVSTNYAKEILSEQYGFGLDGVLRHRAHDITGIINGIDYKEWNPAEDDLIPAKFDVRDITGKAKCKSYLVKECSFKNRKAPLVGMVGRLSSQKGIDIFMGVIDRIFSYGVNVIILGKGEEAIHKELRGIAKKYPDCLSLNIGYDETFAHRVYAGSDMLLIPSKYEPCGLTQMIAMRYGTVPVARATGGIADTVEDYNHLSGKGTGFLFTEYSSSALEECLKRAICVYTDETKWKKIVINCMRQRFSWEKSAKEYVALYRKLVRKVTG
jgi:starch synthase